MSHIYIITLAFSVLLSESRRIHKHILVSQIQAPPTWLAKFPYDIRQEPDWPFTGKTLNSLFIASYCSHDDVETEFILRSAVSRQGHLRVAHYQISVTVRRLLFSFFDAPSLTIGRVRNCYWTLPALPLSGLCPAELETKYFNPPSHGIIILLRFKLASGLEN